MNRAILKSDAKAAMSQASPHPVLVTIVYLVIVYIVQLVVSSVTGIFTLLGTMTEEEALFEVIAAGPTAILSLAALLLNLILQIGYFGYCLRVINRHPTSIGNLFGYFRFFLKAWGLNLVIGLFTFLWTMLFIIPGIIASYRYSLAYYIFAENPEKGIMQCIHESCDLMRGHKMEKFVLDLSFIPWYLLMIPTCGILTIYVTPYVTVTTAGFYNTLKYGHSNFQQSQYRGFRQDGFQQGDYQQYRQDGFQQGDYQQSQQNSEPQNPYQ